MEENEIDILNNNISNETLLKKKRRYLPKLLEAEESQRERIQEEKRESMKLEL